MRRLLALFALCCGLAQAAELPRIALVIGNSSYPKKAALSNPAHDAADISAALKRRGFDVIDVIDGKRAEMQAALQKLSDKLKRPAVVVVFYAGHGIQADGHNYLIPVDAALSKAADLPEQGLELDEVMKALGNTKGSVNIVILDACRNNPFTRSRSMADGGLAQVDAPAGSLIAFSTSPNKVASDGSGRNGLYTQHLLTHLESPGMLIEDVFKRVRIGVVEESDGAQVPWENTSLTGDLRLNPKSAAPLPPRPAPTEPVVVPSPSPAPAPGTKELPWSGPATIEKAKAYLMTHPDGDQREQVLDMFAQLVAKRPLRVAAEQTFERPCPDCPWFSHLYRDDAKGQEELLVGAFHVTVAEYALCVEKGGCRKVRMPTTGRDALIPMTNVTLADAQRYVDWMNSRVKGYRFRLPTEADWLRAFRSGYGKRDRWVERTHSCDIGNLYDISGSLIAAFRWAPIACNDGFPMVAPIGSFLPSEDGLFDLIGNVWHWTTSCAPSASPEDPPCRKVKLFGGSWATAKTIRIDTPPMLASEKDIYGETIGFRLFATRSAQ